MKRILLIVLGLFTLTLLYLFIAGQEVQEIRTEIEISAAPEKVWETLVEVDKWHEWSPIIKNSKGVAAVGSSMDITMVGTEEGSTGPQYRPQVIDLDPPRYFRWRAHMMAAFVFTNDKVFELESTTNGTRLIHKELFKGLLTPVFCGQMEKGVPPMLNAMNQALKKVVEAR